MHKDLVVHEDLSTTNIIILHHCVKTFSKEAQKLNTYFHVIAVVIYGHFLPNANQILAAISSANFANICGNLSPLWRGFLQEIFVIALIDTRTNSQ